MKPTRVAVLPLGLMIVLAMAACGDSGTTESASSRTVASTAPTSSTTTAAASTSSSTSTVAATRRCSGPRGSFEVRGGWYANVQPAGSTSASATCSIVAPASVATRLGIGGDNLALSDQTLQTMEGGPWIRLSTGPSATIILSGIVRSAGSDATVTVDQTGVQLNKAVPALSIRTIEPTSTGTGGLRVRLAYTLAVDNGYYKKGSTAEVLLIQDAAGVTVLYAEFNSTELLGTPSPGITMADVSAALDTIAGSFQPGLLEPPDAPGPAAGVCGTFTGSVAAFSLNIDTPSPRCGIASTSQRVQVTNNRASNVVVRIGVYEAEVKPGETKTIGPVIGEYLAPGHHTVKTVPEGLGPELMVAP